MSNSWFVTTVIFMPLLGSLSMLLFQGRKGHFYHWLALFWTTLTLGLTGVLITRFQNEAGTDASFQLIDQLSWIPQFGIQYQVGVDGLSLPMVVLTALIMVIAVLASWGIEKRPQLYFFLLMMVETAVMGVFTSLDLFLFFVMWELELIPMYFLIGIWGGPRREYASIKFILYTMGASGLMLVSFMAIYFLSPTHTFDVIVLLQHHEAILSNMASEFQTVIYVALFICFAVKLPMVPFHTWLPDAHVEAPTPISVILAGVLLKMGSYGIIRFNLGFFPEITQTLAVGIAILGMINILYGALLALAQTDMKRVIAYSSVSHMGFVLLGLAALNIMGLNGAILQMFTHGTITALLFVFVGIIYDRTHTRDIAQLGGLSARMPLASALFVLGALAAAGAPGMSGFASEFLIFVGAYSNNLTGILHFVIQGVTIASAISIILGAAYMLWLTQRVFFGPLPTAWDNLTDLNRVEALNVAILVAFVIVIGFYPALLVDYINPASEHLISMLPKL